MVISVQGTRPEDDRKLLVRAVGATAAVDCPANPGAWVDRGSGARRARRSVGRWRFGSLDRPGQLAPGFRTTGSLGRRSCDRRRRRRFRPSPSVGPWTVVSKQQTTAQDHNHGVHTRGTYGYPGSKGSVIRGGGLRLAGQWRVEKLTRRYTRERVRRAFYRRPCRAHFSRRVRAGTTIP